MAYTLNLFRGAMDLLFPRHCAGCGGEVGAEARYVCWDCLAQVALIQSPFCEVCGDPMEGQITGPVTCAACVRKAPWFDRARSAARFRGVLRDIIHAFKYQDATWLGRDLNVLLRACYGAHYAACHPDAVTYVPLHALRERERSYNQSLLLAQAMAAGDAGLAVQHFLQRVRPARSQTHLTASERIANVKGMFAVAAGSHLAGQHILLIDDVMTTGATVNECARVLKQGGAAAVWVLTVARG